ncbi:MAG: hypothetical protein ABI609_18965, partial [Acidobacteriota bacterium]
GFAGRVMVVDLDLHDGDGTRAVFAKDPTVFTFSIHNQPWGPPEALASFSLALGTGIDDRRYLAAIREHLPRCFAEFVPELVVYVAGADPAADDRLGDWQISNAGMLERDRVVFGLARGAPRSGPPLPMVVVLAGGYGPDAWRHAARLFSLISSGGRRALEPVSTSEIVLHRFRQMARLLNPSVLSGESGTPANTDDWELAPEDLAGLGGAPHETRFLGFYTLEGLELTLERAGLLDRLRAIGFSEVNLELDLSHSLGQTIRVYGDAARRELLIEVRAHRDRASVPGMEVLTVEWMTLQNPRAEFTSERPPLPGQKHPGLGMTQEILAMMVLACDRLKLDGVLFVPSRFHIVGTVRGPLRFLEPADEALRLAIQDAVRGLPLVEASRRLENDRVVDAATGTPVHWRPAAMVLPVSLQLKARMESAEYEAQVSTARASLDFELLP